MPASTPPPDLSIIVPLHNEEENVEPVTRELVGTAETLGPSWEVILVDDGSTDATGERVRERVRDHPAVRGVRLRRNTGQSAALLAGARAARADVLATMDGDGQNDPADLVRLLEAVREGADAAVGVRVDRADSAVRRLSSGIANAFRNAVTGESVRDTGCALRIVPREAVLRMPAFNGMHRFYPTLLRMQGLEVAQVEVTSRPRTAGTSKYGIRNRLFRGLRDCFGVRWLQKRNMRMEPEEID